MKFLKTVQHLAFVLLILIATSCSNQNNSIINVSDYDHTIKVACVGNSITFGMGIRHRDSLSYPAQLQRMLGDKWEVKNFGVSGRTLLSKGDLPWINEKEYQMALDFEPDVVLIKLGTNDTKPYNWVHSAEFDADYIKLIESFQNLDSNPTVVLMKAVPAYPARWGITDSIINLELNPKVEKLAEKLNLECIDLYTPLIDRGDLFPDKIHPNAAGAKIMATTIKNRLIGKE